MKTLIIEDEKAAVNNLKALLADLAPQCNIVGITDSITDSIKWLQENPAPELVFMDIHLADGSAFEIFEHTEIQCPVIFTTAYDEYALTAFRVSSVDYLLKPIGEKDIKRAFDKMYLLAGNRQRENHSLSQLIKSMNLQKQYKTHFLIPGKGGKLIPLPVDSAMYFFINDGIVHALTRNGESYAIPHTLDELGEILNKKVFFRANRQYLISREAVVDIDYWFNGRLSINLTKMTKDKIIISKARVNEFKEWFSGELL
ncbi:MAG: LytTR family DNA-binding domain-containing protein [Bacteroidales bacterium]|nr:LytTR family DNA-binding domain-containing protein [Bacteroidales bacterium]